ncbi:MAG: hypothetical protein WCB68_13655 [Pyrinomonadaceae bacterium]
MPTRDDIVTEARTWLGTPFGHQGRTKGFEVDCVNLEAEVGLATGAVPDIEFEKTYRRRSDGETMVQLFEQYLDPIEWREALPADVLVIRYSKSQWHCMIISKVEGTEITVIEAGMGRTSKQPEMVTEHRIDWSTKRRIHSAYRVRNLSD